MVVGLVVAVLLGVLVIGRNDTQAVWDLGLFELDRNAYAPRINWRLTAPRITCSSIDEGGSA